MAKKVKSFEVWERYVDLDNNNSFRRTPVAVSDINTIFQSLIRTIDQSNFLDFKALLTSDFIYPGAVNTDFPCASSYSGNRHTRTWGYEHYSVRAVIEVLFHEHNSFFRALVSKVAQSGSINIHSVFLDGFKEQDIPADILTPWSELQRINILNAINEISNYGETAPFDARQKIRSKHAQELANLLSDDLKNLPSLDNSPSSLVKWLDFKFKLLSDLHSKDTHFIGHLGWKRAILNLASLIFSAGILNLINFAVTGNFLFFNQTTTQSMVSTLDQHIKTEQYIMNP